MIHISDLTAGYGSKTVISRFSFSTEAAGSPVVLAGRNGSGKSTLLKAILGEIPFEGKIEMGVKSNGIGWLPQRYQVSLSIPVVDFVALGAVQKGSMMPINLPNAKNLAFHALENLRIGHLAQCRTDEISGGEWQLICLAQLQVQPTNVWLLDEPTASLDIYYKKLVFSFLWEKAKEGTTILVATHDLPFLPEAGGSILVFGNPPTLLQNSAEGRAMAMHLIENR